MIHNEFIGSINVWSEKAHVYFDYDAWETTQF